MVKCKICKKREGILDFAEGILEFTHGFVTKICRECFIKRIEKELIKIKANLKKQKRLLKEESRKRS